MKRAGSRLISRPRFQPREAANWPRNSASCSALPLYNFDLPASSKFYWRGSLVQHAVYLGELTRLIQALLGVNIQLPSL
jgi:hypothetical protein